MAADAAAKHQNICRNCGKFGVNLCHSLFGEKNGIKLHIPFGQEFQEKAEGLFCGAFSYYRNYAVHDGTKINKFVSIRVLVIASELLDLIGASPLSFIDIGGVEGLVKEGVFTDAKELFALLRFLDGYTFPEESFDGFYEDLALKGFSDIQLQAVLDTGLVEYVVEPYIPSAFERINDLPESLGCFHLTPMGKEIRP